LYNNLDSCGDIHCALRQLKKKKKLRAFANTIAHVANAQSIHSGSYKRKTMDDNQKKFIPQLAIDTEFFHCTFVNPCMMYNHLPIEYIMGNYCTRWRPCFKGLSLDGGRADFRDASFNIDLSNEPLSAGSISLDSTFNVHHAITLSTS
jgi:hypothetical protein